MEHCDIINYLIEKYNYQSYLEIGLGGGQNFLRVKCRNKECVDPYNNFRDGDKNEAINKWVIDNILTYRMTSDEFFETEGKDKKYDIIFIDGLHTEEQVDRDIINSLKHLNEGGKIVLHDCIPNSERAQLPFEERQEGDWNGTTWKSIPKLTLMGVDFVVVATDFGCGIVNYFPHPETLQVPPPADYSYQQVFSSMYITNIMLRIISPEAFKQIF